MNAAAVEWLVATIVVALCAAAAVFGAATRRHWLGLPSLVPVAAGLFVRTSGPRVTLPSHSWIVALSIAMTVLAVVAGGPLVTWVLKLTDRSSHSGRDTSRSDILRGGATIGYLERIAVVAAVGLGRVEIVGAVIAIKGLGRFTELDSSEARERFIIGTLVSLLWAGLAAALIWPPS